ncbi:MAG TPA: twin-arginine translocation signal domain-containing protein, partial [Bryobacteraceae bacterium]
MKHDSSSRRQFLAGLSSAGMLAAAAPPPSVADAIGNTEPLKITRVDAVTFREGIHAGGNPGGPDGAEFCWVRLHTNRGLIGTGETYPFAHA